MKPRRAEIDKAIALIEDARQSHVDAIDYVRRVQRATKHFDKNMAKGVAYLVGTMPFHRQAIREYAFVLKILRACR